MDTTLDIRPTTRRRTFEILGYGRRRAVASRILDGVLVFLIVANVAAAIAQTLPDIATRYGRGLQIFDRLCVLIFAVEYAARIWVAPEHLMQHRRGPIGARLKFATTPMMIIDALALLPWLLEILFPHNAIMPLTRFVRLLKLARYVPALATIGRVAAAQRRTLFACIIILAGMLSATVAVILAVEGHAQPERLGDMPKVMWWVASMSAKIGVGEFAPVTALGRIVSVAIVMLGFFCFALAVTIIGLGIYEEIRRREADITIAMVARVPLFANLDATSITDLVNILKWRTVPAATTIVRKGERGDAMYLIASGIVEVSTGLAVVHLIEGDYFGEMELLSPEPRSATVTTVCSTDLLVLNADALLRLIDRIPAIKDQVETVTRERRQGKAG